MASIAEGLLREQRELNKVVGDETRLNRELFARYPRGTGETRGVELAALHVVGDVALSDATKQQRRMSSGAMPAVRPSEGGLPRPNPSSSNMRASRPEEGMPLPRASSSSQPPPPPTGSQPGRVEMPRRRSSASSSMRAIHAMLLPAGSPPPAIAAYVAPLVTETAARLLIGALRAHDLLVIRNVTLDDTTADTLASLVSSAEAPPGAYDVTRAAEIARWQASIGDAAVGALRKAMNAAAVELARTEILRAKVDEKLANSVSSSLCSFFPKDPPDDLSMSRYRHATGDFEDEVARAATDVLEGHTEAGDLKAALGPLIGIAREDIAAAAAVVHHAAKPTVD